MGNLSSFQYMGNVDIKLRVGQHIVNLKSKHNKGTLTLSKAFSLFMSGYSEAFKYIPKYIDLQKESKDEVSGKPVWTSSLLKPIAITAPSFKYDENLNNWVSLSTAVIPAEMLIEPIIISSDFEQNNYRLCLLCEELADPLVSRELAYFEAINDKDLAKITPGTQAIIEWRMQLLQEVTSKNTDTEEANLNG